MASPLPLGAGAIGARTTRLGRCELIAAGSANVVVIPRVVHFVFGLRPQDEPFHLLQYLAIESCRRLVAPEEIVVHLHHLPYGVYWDLARALVTVDRIPLVDGLPPSSGLVAKYSYAHQADVVRLDVLSAEGGLYADIDTLFVRPVPDHLWLKPAVIGEEAPVSYADAAAPEASLSNALLMAEPRAWFVATWRRRIISAMDGSWSQHSSRLATRLADERPDEVHVEPRRTFHPFEHSVEGMADLLERPYVSGCFDATVSVHTCAHLWWDSQRRDFSSFCALDATEHHLATADTALAQLAKPFLPEHGLF